MELASDVGGLAFFWNYHASPLAAWRTFSWPVRVAVGVLLISPLGYYLGIVNPYLANCIYSGNFIIGVRIPANTHEIAPPTRDTIAGTMIPKDWQSLGSETSREPGMSISLHQASDMFQRFFAKTGKPHERMILYYPGWMSMFTGIQERELWLGHGEKINGQEQGHWIYYDETGTKNLEGNYQQGVQSGHWIKWRPDGTKDSEGPMFNNKYHGQWKFYDPDGTVTATFKDGVHVE